MAKIEKVLEEVCFDCGNWEDWYQDFFRDKDETDEDYHDRYVKECLPDNLQTMEESVREEFGDIVVKVEMGNTDYHKPVIFVTFDITGMDEFDLDALLSDSGFEISEDE